MAILFIGERRSNRAKQLGVTWEMGGLAAKQLHDALRANGINPTDCRYTNWFEDDESVVINHVGPRIAMGIKVQKALMKRDIDFTPMIHPAARGRIRRKDRYMEHVRDVLTQVL